MLVYNSGMPKQLTILSAKIAFRIGRLFGKGGSALPGLVAERIDPQVLSKLVRGNFRKGIILITGTNGKTTTALLTAEILRADGRTVLHNRGGSNLMRGLLSTMIQACNLGGRVKADTAVFEVDENAFPAIVAAVKPTHIIVTNLFRDQLDRYGELDATAQKLAGALRKADAMAWLNADDPLVASLASATKNSSFFGVQASTSTKLDDEWSADSLVSPKSGVPLIYSKRYYSHIGIYKSSNGDFSRPKADIEATHPQAKQDQLSFQLKLGNREITVRTKLGGFYNVYNVLAAVAVTYQLGVSPDTIRVTMQESKPAFGRLERIDYKGRELYLLLVKNPVGFNQIIETFLLPDHEVSALIIINDNIADGRDVSWLWDANLEALSEKKRNLIVSGQRADDMALRLKYANVAKFTTKANPEHGIDKLVTSVKPGQKIYIVPTYTAMLSIRSWLAKKTGIQEYWQ